AAVLAAGGLIAAALPANAGAEPFALADSQLEPVQWSELEGWAGDDHVAAFAAYQTSCRAFRNLRRAPSDRGPVYQGLGEICRRAVALRPLTGEAAQSFFEENFRPVRIAKLGEAEGFLTGYYEPIVQGSRFPSPEFHVPLYRRPRDLLIGGRKPGAAALPNKGAMIGRR